MSRAVSASVRQRAGGGRQLDAVVVPSGGLLPDRTVQPWVVNRLERAQELAGAETPFLLLSAGTTHKPLPIDPAGGPVFESAASARLLLERGVDPGRLFTEAASYDTIGNAYFARVIHCDPAGWRRLAVVTSEFHMPRTEAIFRWIFGAEPCVPAYELSFHPVPDVGMDADVLAARRAKEAQSLESVRALSTQHSTIREVHAWLFREHAAYAVGRSARAAAEGMLLRSY